MAENEEELKSILIKVKQESERVSLTLKKLRSWHPVPSLHDKQKEKKWKQWQILFSWAPKSLWTMTAAMKLNDTYSWEISYDKPRQCIKKQKHRFANKCLSSQSYDFFSSHVHM